MRVFDVASKLTQNRLINRRKLFKRKYLESIKLMCHLPVSLFASNVGAKPCLTTVTGHPCQVKKGLRKINENVEDAQTAATFFDMSHVASDKKKQPSGEERCSEPSLILAAASFNDRSRLDLQTWCQADANLLAGDVLVCCPCCSRAPIFHHDQPFFQNGFPG